MPAMSAMASRSRWRIKDARIIAHTNPGPAARAVLESMARPDTLADSNTKIRSERRAHASALRRGIDTELCEPMITHLRKLVATPPRHVPYRHRYMVEHSDHTTIPLECLEVQAKNRAAAITSLRIHRCHVCTTDATLEACIDRRTV